MKKVLGLVLLLLLASSASAQTLGSDGYYYFAGYAEPYTRTLVTTPGYYQGRCYYPGSSYYSYSVYVAPYAAPIKAPSYTPYWKEEIVKYAAQRDDHATYLLALKALGVQGQLYQFQQGYGYGYQNSYGVNASTPYGYSYQTIAALYGDTNMNQLYQQSAQLTAGAQSLASDANSGFQQIVAQTGANQARVAEILAKGQAGAQVLKALSPNTLQQTTTVFGSTPGNGGQKPPAGDTDKEQKFLAFQQLVSDRCASCHTGESKKGGFDISGYLGFSAGQKERVISTLTTNDPNRAMPRSPNGGVGQRLTEAEINLFRIH
jgi:mono/diheme cytochrome c family protein